MENKHNAVLAVDCGGTFLKIAVIDQQGNISDKTSIPTLLDLSAFLKSFEDLAHQYHSQISAIGIAFAGPVNSELGLIGEPPNFPKSFHNLPLASILEKRCQIPVALENDANLAALGEYWKGPHFADNILVVITLGTGVGSGIIVNGKIWNGATGIAGEIGHIPVYENGPICGCGNIGCLETFASSTAVVRMAKEMIAQNCATTLSKIQDITAKDVYEATLHHDQVACDIFTCVGKALGRGIGTIIHILGVGKIILTGGGAGAYHMFAPSMKATYEKMCFQQERTIVQVIPSTLEGNSGILGAAYLAWEKLGIKLL